MTEIENEIPIAEVYKGCEIFGLQTVERIAEAKLQIDQVYRMSAPRALAEFAVDGTRAPEARHLARHKAMAALENRQKAPFDVEYLVAGTIGIERRASQLGRLIGHRQEGADWWPEAWLREQPTHHTNTDTPLGALMAPRMGSK